MSYNTTVESIQREGIEDVNQVSIVIPVYQGEKTLASLLAEIEPLTRKQVTAQGHTYQVREVILVHDDAIDHSDEVMEALEDQYSFVSLIWLSRNFGQHAATLAGMASSKSDWMVTLDEDGQFDPSDIGKLLDKALEKGIQLVYGRPQNQPEHGWLRNQLSRTVKWIFVTLLEQKEIGHFSSFRLVQGDIARSLAAFCGSGVYLDAALAWVVSSSEYCPILVRGEGDRSSGYNYRKLIGHFLNLLLTTGTKPLRLISIIGFGTMFIAILITVYVLWKKMTSQILVPGWTFLTILICFFSGLILFSLGVITECLGVLLRMSFGKPLYLTVSRPSKTVKKK